jgi:hypothetical protein
LWKNIHLFVNFAKMENRKNIKTSGKTTEKEDALKKSAL